MANSSFSSGGGGGNRGKRYPRRDYGPRKNERIRVPEIRVIGPEGKQIGVMKTREALEQAKAAGLDLVEVSPTARPPVCRILDYGKYMYEESKKKKKSGSSSGTAKPKLKEVKFRVRTDQHDYMVKIKHAEEFLFKGNKVKLSLMFRGREHEHKELGVETIQRAAEDLTHVAHIDAAPRLMGRNVTATLSPLPANKRKRKYTEEGEELPEDQDNDQDNDTDNDTPEPEEGS